MGSVYDTAIDDVAADRGGAATQIRSLIEAGPYSAEDAKARGLIDNLGQVKDAETAILAKAGPGAKLTDFDDYAGRARLRGRAVHASSLMSGFHFHAALDPECFLRG